MTEPPYCFVHAASPEGSHSYLRQYEALAEERHHRVSVYLCKRFGEQMRQIALGNVAVIDEAIRKDVQTFVSIPLCSDVAEGYHRGAQLTHQRALGVKLPFLFATARLPHNLECVLRRCQEPDGEAEFRR